MLRVIRTEMQILWEARRRQRGRDQDADLHREVRG